jgi:plastocyanin
MSRRTLVLAALPLLAGFKCLELNPAFDRRTDGGMATGGDLPPAGDMPPFRPAKPCAQPATARITVANFAFNVECGCAEAEGETCTIPAGTTLIWTFADSEEHNVTSLAGSFGMSPNKLSGEFSYTFTFAGEHHYNCTLHSGMHGSILIK